MKTTNLGFPNVYDSLIKKAVEGFWNKKNSIEDIISAEKQVIEYNSKIQSLLDLQQQFDIDIYDRFLRTAVMFGLVQEQFGSSEEANADLSVYLSIPRGIQSAKAAPMVKWFNTNYHVVQPEITQDPFLVRNPRLPVLDPDKKFALIGPWTLLSYSFNKTNKKKEELFEILVDQYQKFINQLPNKFIQLEEPSFLTHGMPDNYDKFVSNLNKNIHLHVYFGSVNDFAEKLFELSVAGFGLDFIDGSSNIELLNDFPKEKELIAGIINGRNVWPISSRIKNIIDEVAKKISDEKLYISPSCSLMHVPLSAKNEVYNFSFALEKIKELDDIKKENAGYFKNDPKEENLPAQSFERKRKKFWTSDIPYPTTTIGSFPQTEDVRKIRRKLSNHKISEEEYCRFIKSKIKECIAKQEELGLDVLVHGEFERADMVQYFAENLEGFVPINSPVQSYGTRHVKPPVVISEIKRLNSFTVDWIKYAQSLTKRPVKGMLTGPVTLVQWSYPREDISREAQFYQFAKALAEEVDDLVSVGIKHIQIDEPAIREGLPVDKAKQDNYLRHAINAFRFVYHRVPDDVVIHSHMCFSEFNDIIEHIKKMGVDVLSIEDSKAKGKTANCLKDGGFPASIGLGVYDVHSPRIPSQEEILQIPCSLNIDPRRIWINPDCGLKTRGEEAYAQLEQMMKACYKLRKSLLD